jgi:hypothetical protein
MLRFASLQDLQNNLQPSYQCHTYFQLESTRSIDLIANNYRGPLNCQLNLSNFLSTLIGYNLSELSDFYLNSFSGIALKSGGYLPVNIHLD